LPKYGEALDFLAKVYEQQKAQQKAQQDRAQREDRIRTRCSRSTWSRRQARPGRGSPQALVTIVEAWILLDPSAQRDQFYPRGARQGSNGKVRVVFKTWWSTPSW